MISLLVKHREAIPFAIAAIGVLLDALTTVVGLSMGFYESHPNYNPILALAIFWSLIAVTRILPRTRFIRLFTVMLSTLPFLGVINNSLVIMGIFPGLAI